MSGSLDPGDLHAGVRLPMTLRLRRVLPATEGDVDDLLVLALSDDLARDGGAIDRGLAHGHLVAVRGEENVLELHGIADGAVELLDADGVALGDLVLLSTRLDDGVHELGAS